jgi:hypothetical protein
MTVIHSLSLSAINFRLRLFRPLARGHLPRTRSLDILALFQFDATPDFGIDGKPGAGVPKAAVKALIKGGLSRLHKTPYIGVVGTQGGDGITAAAPVGRGAGVALA